MLFTRVFTFLNNKGGVGKTTGAINLAAALAEAGKSVLLIDADAQRNATMHVASMLMTSGAPTLSPVMTNDTINLWDAIVSTGIENLSMIMADPDIETNLESYKKNWMRPSERLREKIAALDGLVDFIIIDSPPNLGLMVENALAASTHFIIPVDPGAYSEMGLINLEHQILKKIYQVNPTLKCFGVLPVMTRKGTAVDKNMSEKETFGEGEFRKLPVSIPWRQSVVNQSYTGELAVSKKSSSDIAHAYRKLAKLVIKEAALKVEPSLVEKVSA
ncbi:AAA family ATPase [Pseudomonas putida]|nr:AAA family ATPase [Pseudomonas putida]